MIHQIVRRIFRKIDEFTLKRLVATQGTQRMVAVILGYNGWSTVNRNDRHMLFDYELATMLDTPQDLRNYHAIEGYIKKKYPHARLDSADCLYLRWIPEGTDFVVGYSFERTNGTEFVVYRDGNDWITA